MSTENPKHRRHRRSDRAVLIACVIAIIVTTYNAVQVQRVEMKVSGQQAHIGRQFQQLIQACVRLNILRAEDNVSHFVDYRVYRIVYLESLANLKKLQRIPPREATAEHKFLVQLKLGVRQKSWTPLTNCRQAVSESGAFYRSPQPILFIHRLPPREDLYPKPGSPALG